MKQTISVTCFLTSATIVTMGCLATPLATAQTPAGANAIYIARASTSDCAPGLVSMQVAGGVLSEMSKTGAPYSAVGTLETIQTLADGNRIVRTNTSHTYRDSSGRVRMEMSLFAVGPFTLDETSAVVTIMDPVGKQRFMLHPQLKRAEVLPLVPGKVVAVTSPMKQNAGAGSVVTFTKAEALPSTAPQPLPQVRCPGLPPSTSVSLGQKTLFGLTATGTRIEYTIPAGQIGNEQPITVTKEDWVSDELGVILSSTGHDPLIGDTQFHLSQIERTEPDPSLFVVPADYTVTDVTANKAIMLQRSVPPG